MNKPGANPAANESQIELELVSVEVARGRERQELTREFVTKHIVPELTKHHAFLIEGGMLNQADLHPVVFECLEAIYGGSCMECVADQTAQCGSCLICLTRAPVGRAPTKEGRNQLLFEKVEKMLETGLSLAAASRLVSEGVIKGDIDGVEQQVLSARTVRNIYRKLLKVI